MRIIKDCIGTMDLCLPIEFIKDTVYVKENIKRIQYMGINAWQYDETQYTIKEYNVLIAQELVKENNELRKEIAEMSSYILDLEFKTLGGV